MGSRFISSRSVSRTAGSRILAVLTPLGSMSTFCHVAQRSKTLVYSKVNSKSSGCVWPSAKNGVPCSRISRNMRSWSFQPSGSFTDCQIVFQQTGLPLRRVSSTRRAIPSSL